MGNDFKSYVKNNKNLSKQDLQKMAENVSPTDVKKVESFAKQYENMNEQQLLTEIQKMSNSGVSQGELNNFANNVMPMLDAQQKKKLEQVIKMLRR